MVMKRKEIINEEVADVVNDGSAGIGHSGAKEEKKLPWYVRLWNWIKKVIGL